MSQKTISKAVLCEMYGFSATYLWKLLNNDYFEELSAVGYKKRQKILPPKVVEKFYELYGEPNE